MNLVRLNILYRLLKTCSNYFLFQNKVPTSNKVFMALKLSDLESFRAKKASNLATGTTSNIHSMTGRDRCYKLKKYVTNIPIYSNICLRICDIRIWILIFMVQKIHLFWFWMANIWILKLSNMTKYSTETWYSNLIMFDYKL